MSRNCAILYMQKSIKKYNDAYLVYTKWYEHTLDKWKGAGFGKIELANEFADICYIEFYESFTISVRSAQQVTSEVKFVVKERESCRQVYKLVEDLLFPKHLYISSVCQRVMSTEDTTTAQLFFCISLVYFQVQNLCLET